MEAERRRNELELFDGIQKLLEKFSDPSEHEPRANAKPTLLEA